MLSRATTGLGEIKDTRKLICSGHIFVYLVTYLRIFSKGEALIRQRSQGASEKFFKFFVASGKFHVTSPL